MEFHCSNPLRIHPLKKTRNKGAFRRVNQKQISNNPDVNLCLGDWVCNECRHRLDHPEVLATNSSEMKASNDVLEKKSHSVLCSNPLGKSNHNRRKMFMEYFRTMKLDWVHKLLEKKIIVKEGDKMCLQCHDDILAILSSDLAGKYCENPLKSRHDGRKKKSVFCNYRKVTAAEVLLCSRLGICLNPEGYLCRGCRKDLEGREQQYNRENNLFTVVEDNSELMEVDEETTIEHVLGKVVDESDGESEDYYEPEISDYAILAAIMKCLDLLLLAQADLRKGSQGKDLYSVIQAKVGKLITSVSGRKNINCSPCIHCTEFVEQASRKFQHLEEKRDKYLLLTTTPKWVTISNFITFFGVSKAMAENVSRLRNTEGPFTANDPKIGKVLDESIIATVKAFYLSPENATISPALNDVVITGRSYVDGKLILEKDAKHFMQTTMKQLYQEFKLAHPDKKLSVSKFASLRPKQCRWGFRTGFHKSCLCVYHKHFELLLDAIRLSGRTSDRIDNFFCRFSYNCHFGLCEACPKWTSLNNALIDKDNVEYYQWISEGSATGINLKPQIAPIQDFKEYFQKTTIAMGVHHFIYIKQKEYIAKLKAFENLSEDVGVLFVDFGQNYSFTMNEEVSGYHWRHNQSTVHPFVLFYKISGKVDYEVFTVFSDCMTHDATSFHVFRSVVINKYIKVKHPYIKYINYVSDGTGAQYKNHKNCVNLVNHNADFGIDAKWTFSAPAHGKSPSDRESAITKKTLRTESRRRKTNFITTVREAQEYLQSQNNSVYRNYVYISNREVMQIIAATGVESRYSKYKNLKGIRQFHELRPHNNGILAKKFSSEEEEYETSFQAQSLYPSLEIMREAYNLEDYIACLVNHVFMIGTIFSPEVDGEFQVNLMKKCEKGQGFKWYDLRKVVTITADDIVCKLNVPVTATGRIYLFDITELNEAKAKANMVLLARVSV